MHAGANCREVMCEGCVRLLRAFLLCDMGTSAYVAFLQMREGKLLVTVL
jgi:hypothetical protein